jgi:hypothetical protein
VPVCGLIAQYKDRAAVTVRTRLPATMRPVLSKSLTLRGFMEGAIRVCRELFGRSSATVSVQRGQSMTVSRALAWLCEELVTEGEVLQFHNGSATKSADRTATMEWL